MESSSTSLRLLLPAEILPCSGVLVFSTMLLLSHARSK